MADREDIATEERSEDGEGRRQGIPVEEWTRSFNEWSNEWSRSMPDVSQVERWIRENPETSMLGAAGIGVLAGSWLFTGARPAPTFSERVQATAFEVTDDVRDRTEETRRNLSRTVTEQARQASKEASQASDSARRYGQQAFNAVRQQARENPELTRMVANALYAGAAAVLVKRLNSWVEE